ncbi:MAG TPA: transcription termination factor NusA [Candidatus Omnitrophota bacterium]|nr:transcription termination factor NusA [Candidatus Omnitrophota bacterium]
MKKTPNFKSMFEEIEKERGIKEADLIAALKDALLTAAKKRIEHTENLEVDIAEDGGVKIIDKETGKEVTPSDFGRIAAQTAKQVIVQRLREAEKEMSFNEYHDKVGELVIGTVQRQEYSGYLVNLGKLETFLANQDVIPGETLRPKEKVKVLISEVKRTGKGPMVIISRTHPDFIRKLFESEIPEFSQGILEIKGIAREPGRRTKVAVISHDPDVGAVGTCIGPMGSRIQTITREVKSERIDVIEWSDKPDTFIANALAPAKSVKVKLIPGESACKVIIPEKELSLAIGKDGQNVRLAAKLTGYKIDIVSEEKLAEEKAAKAAEKEAAEAAEKKGTEE